MREIKFRAWNKKLSKMVDYDTIKKECNRLTFVTEPLEGWIIMQYTGLHDINGKEICEGDIVKQNGGRWCRKEYKNSIYEVFWDNEHAQLSFKHIGGGKSSSIFRPHTSCKDCGLKIVGNIYENTKELLTHRLFGCVLHKKKGRKAIA